MKTKINCNRFSIIALLLGLLGFSASCKDSMVVEYGSPNADYKVKLTVTDQQNVPIKGIQIALQNQYKFYGDSVQTNGIGMANVSWKYWPKQDSVHFSIKDIDGAANGLYKDTLVNEKTTFKKVADGSGAWYEGAYEGELTIKIKEQ